MTRYDLLRKRIAPFAFLLGLGLLVHQSCQQAERTHATIVFELGAAAPRVVAIDATLLVEGEVTGLLHRRAMPGLQIGEPRFEVTMPQRHGELQIDVELADGKRHIVRQIRAEDRATVRVALGADLL